MYLLSKNLVAVGNTIFWILTSPSPSSHQRSLSSCWGLDSSWLGEKWPPV